jgi:hypothetical protein
MSSLKVIVSTFCIDCKKKNVATFKVIGYIILGLELYTGNV